ncbi:MAG: hypothetical protein RI928_1980 [Pseudomonadota bacterium]
MAVNYRTCLVGMLAVLGASAASAHGLVSDHSNHSLTDSPVFLLNLFIAIGVALSANRFFNRK